MEHEENNFRKEFKFHAEAYGAYAKVTHGNMFQAGLPDLMIWSKTGLGMCAELKYWENAGLPKTAACLHKLLKRTQPLVVKKELWGRDAHCLVIAVLNHNKNLCAIAYKDQMAITDWRVVAKLMAEAVSFTTVLQYVFHD